MNYKKVGFGYGRPIRRRKNRTAYTKEAAKSQAKGACAAEPGDVLDCNTSNSYPYGCSVGT